MQYLLRDIPLRALNDQWALKEGQYWIEISKTHALVVETTVLTVSGGNCTGLYELPFSTGSGEGLKGLYEFELRLIGSVSGMPCKGLNEFLFACWSVRPLELGTGPLPLLGCTSSVDGASANCCCFFVASLQHFENLWASGNFKFKANNL